MKKIDIYLTLLLVAFSGFAAAHNIVNGQVKKSVNGLNITIDKRFEMLSVIQYLAESKAISLKKIAYVDSVKKHFDPYKNHKVVELYKEMERKGFNADAPVRLMLFLNSKFEVEKKLDAYILARAKDENRLNELIKELQNFNAESNFDGFFSNNYRLFEQTIDIVIDKSLRDFDEIGTIENFYGYRQNSYNIVLMALSAAGYGPRMDAGNGKYDIYNVLGFSHSENGVPVYGNEKTFRYMVWHEFSHSFVNPLVDKHYKEFEKYKALEKPILNLMRKVGYGRWDVILYEHIVRAVTAVLTHKQYGAEKANLDIKAERDQGFIYIDSLYSKILAYSIDTKGKSFDQFFPELINVFKSYAENPVDFKYIPVPVDFFSENADFALVYSTNEESDSLNIKMKEYVDYLNKNFYEIPEKNIIPDTLALKMNLKDYYIFCYGSINGNLWLKSKVKDLPIQISPDRIVAAKTFNQSNLKVISTWVNPDNPNKFMIIYTAQKGELAHDFDFFHGPSHYVIADDKLEVIDMGDYRYKDGKFQLQ